MKRFNEAYLNHGNVYTNTRYKDEPAIVALLITNENDLTNHFGNALLPDQERPEAQRPLQKPADAFAAANGLPKRKTWRSWEQRPVQAVPSNDLEHRFDADNDSRPAFAGRQSSHRHDQAAGRRNPLSAASGTHERRSCGCPFVWAHGGAREEPVDRRQSDSLHRPRHGSRVSRSA